MSDDPFCLRRFVEAQEQIYPHTLAEIRAGAERSHWMWFIFPQNLGLGRSPMATRFGIRSIAEAQAYLEHPVLGARLRECVAALAAVPVADPVAVFGSIDAMKLRSSLTLFEKAGGGPLFRDALDRWYDGKRDPVVLTLM